MDRQINSKEDIVVVVHNRDFVRVESRGHDSTSLSSTLCCCEYINRDDERFHLLGCCCNCSDFDAVFTSLIKCREIEQQNSNGMLLTFQDRLRIPWRGGAKRVAWDTAVPLLIILPAILLAARSAIYAAVMFATCSMLIAYMYRYLRITHKRTRFFMSWLSFSLINMIVLYELTVPLLELLPEENFILSVLSLCSIGCFIYTKLNAASNHVAQSVVTDDDLPDITEASAAEEEEAATTSQTALLIDHPDYAQLTSAERHQPNMCSICHKYVAARTVHCNLCNACIMRRNHHSHWLDCCIGERNYRYYFFGLMFGELALLLGANLILTAVCHPFLVVRLLSVPVMLPDDCSDVFDDYSLALSFVIALYALLMAIFVLVELLTQIYYISYGITAHERLNGHRGSRKGCLGNWKAFLLGTH